ncbi:hypothetical protein ES703_102866 [subsurface metagenome]
MVKQINKGDDLTAPDVGISVKEAGHRGGTATRDRHGVKFLREIAKKGGETTKRRWGHLYSEFGKRGGRPRRSNLDMGGESPQTKEVENAVGSGSPPPA